MKKDTNIANIRLRNTLIYITVALISALMVLGTVLPQKLAPIHYRATIPYLGKFILDYRLDDIYSSPIFLNSLYFLSAQLILGATIYVYKAYKQHTLKNLFQYGSISINLGLGIIVMCLALSNSQLSYEGHLQLIPSQSVAIPELPQISVTLDSFEINFNEDGSPKSYKSKLTFEGDGKSSSQICAVNSPAHFGSLDMYQSGCGMNSFEISIIDTKRQFKPQTFLIYTGPRGELTKDLPLLTFAGEDKYRYLVHRFYPHAVLSGGKIIGHSDRPGQATAMILELEINDTLGEKNNKLHVKKYRNLGWLNSKNPIKTAHNLELHLGNIHTFSDIRYKRDAGYPGIALGTIIAIFGAIVKVAEIRKQNIQKKIHSEIDK